MNAKLYSLRKARKILRLYFTTFRRKRHCLSKEEGEAFEAQLRQLDSAVLAGQRAEASESAQKLEAWCKKHNLRGSRDLVRETFWALLFALIVAGLIRQFWFELYEVPTGSMRPTIQELDRLTVSKTTFGLHLPWTDKLLFYSPNFLKRAGIIVLTTKDLDIPDSDTLYFGFLPGKKQYVKRCVGRPGDTLYFYGGYIYGIDREGNPFTDLCDPQTLTALHLENIDHVPYISMEGRSLLKDKTSQGFYRSATFKQMNQPVARLSVTPAGQIEGQFFDGTGWVKDEPAKLKTLHDHPVSYSDLWGIGHFAMTRLLDAEEARKFYGFKPTDDAVCYLELRHTPNLSTPKPLIRRGENGKIYPMITPYTALLPIDSLHFDRLQKSLYTTRFCVRQEQGFPYQKGQLHGQPAEFDIALPHVPRGCYEFYQGVGYHIAIGGFRSRLPATHPLYNPTLLRSLFNCGIGWNRLFEPMAPHQSYHPHRYAYYRNGDLYVMGAPLFTKEEPLLQRFVAEEKEKEITSSPDAPYIAFIDRHAPLRPDGSLDSEKIVHFGLKIPEEGFIALGDNYAMSADSRDFGFVPIHNLRGAPSFTFWPFSSRLGPLVQPPYPWFTLPNCLIWGIVTFIIFLSLWIGHKQRRTSLF